MKKYKITLVYIVEGKDMAEAVNTFEQTKSKLEYCHSAIYEEVTPSQHEESWLKPKGYKDTGEPEDEYTD